jgi:hypothetical protein
MQPVSTKADLQYCCIKKAYDYEIRVPWPPPVNTALNFLVTKKTGNFLNE